MNVFSQIGKIGLYAVNVIVSFSTILSAFAGYVNPDTFAPMQVVAMTFPVWVVILLLLVVVDLFFVRRMALMLLTTIVICIKPFLTYFPCHLGGNSDATDKSEFKVLTYNVFNFNERVGEKNNEENGMLSYIIDSDADIVCLQEGELSFSMPGNRYNSQLKLLKSRYPYIIDGRSDGNVLLSRYPAKVEEISHPEWGSGRFTVYRLDVEGREMTLINCHLQSIGLTPQDKELYRELTDRQIKATKTELKEARYWILPKLSNAFRLRAQQARMLKEIVEKSGTDVILVGDFNDVPGSYAYRTITSAGLHDAYSDAAFGPTITYNDNRFYFRIDHILYKGDFKAVDVERGHLKSSDHYPLLATFVWDAAE